MALELSIDAEATLGRIEGKLDRDADERRQEREIARARVPMIVTLKNAGVIPTPTAPFGINFGGPDAGFEWVVRRWVVGGLKWDTTASGTAELYVTGLGSLHGSTGAGGIAGIRSTVDIVDQATAMPYKQTYTRDTIVVKENESLVAVILTGTQAQQYVSSVLVQVVRTSAAVWGLRQGI